MKKLFTLMVVVSILLMANIAGADNNITFRWQANTEPDLARYKLYQTDTSGDYTKAQVVGEGNLVAIIIVDLSATPPIHPTEYTLNGVVDGEHFWVLTAVDVSNNESDFSNEVSAILDSTPPDAPTILQITAIVRNP